MAVKDGIMPNGRNKFGGRKPAFPPAPTGGLMGNPPAGKVGATAKPTASSPSPSRSKVSAFGTHPGATAHQGKGPTVVRRTLPTNAK